MQRKTSTDFLAGPWVSPRPPAISASAFEMGGKRGKKSLGMLTVQSVSFPGPGLHSTSNNSVPNAQLMASASPYEGVSSATDEEQQAWAELLQRAETPTSSEAQSVARRASHTSSNTTADSDDAASIARESAPPTTSSVQKPPKTGFAGIAK